jgi:hypothetical protein
MTDYLDHYCERITPGFWGEPLNLFSNLAFVIAAVVVWRIYLSQRNKITDHFWDIKLLIALFLAIGIGSSLWHIFATSWSLKADTIPILLFINLYLLSCLFRVFSLSVIAGISIFAAYHIVNISVQSTLPADFLNGSIFYLPTWFFLLGITFFVWQLRLAGHHYYINALILFSTALVFRTIDQFICETIATGTHFIWHLLIAVTLYLLMRGLLSNTIADKYKAQT